MFPLDLALQDVNIEKLGDAVAGRVVARRISQAQRGPPPLKLRTTKRNAAGHESFSD
jgi:hypothetical protein